MIIYAFFGQRRRQAVVSRPMHSRFNIFRVNSPPYLYLTRNECTAQWTFVCMCLAKLLNHIQTADRLWSYWILGNNSFELRFESCNFADKFDVSELQV